MPRVDAQATDGWTGVGWLLPRKRNSIFLETLPPRASARLSFEDESTADMDKQQNKRVGTPQDDVDPGVQRRQFGSSHEVPESRRSRCGRPDQPTWTRIAWQMGIPKASIRQIDPIERGLHSLANPPPGFELGQNNGKPEKGAKGREGLPGENKDTEEAESVFGSLNHGADAEGLAMAVHSVPMVVVVPATSDRESVPFGRRLRLKDPQAAGGQCSG